MTQKAMNGLIRHCWTPTALGVQLVSLLKFSFALKVFLHYPSVQSRVDFPLLATSRVIGSSPIGNKLYTTVFTGTNLSTSVHSCYFFRLVVEAIWILALRLTVLVNQKAHKGFLSKQTSCTRTLLLQVRHGFILICMQLHVSYTTFGSGYFSSFLTFVSSYLIRPVQVTGPVKNDCNKCHETHIAKSEQE